MDRYEAAYALSKQLDSMFAIHTNYGNIDLDPELTEAVQAALRPILEKRAAAESEE